jgi:beta-aspartyl-peptidase (threonine type)
LKPERSSSFAIIVHGGAWDIPCAVHDDHLIGVEKAVMTGHNILKDGISALKAVIEAVIQMENDPTFDAGYGSFMNKNGDVEMDAIVMTGSDLSMGAVAAIQNVSNPVQVAELIRQRTDHNLLVGEGAVQFALEQGIPYVPTEQLLVGRELERYRKLKKKKKIRTRHFFESGHQTDTVGAVAIDKKGNIAVATSTGGTPNKLPGRVGDSPIIGSGAYADNLYGGASSSGWGESLMKVLLAKSTVDFMRNENDAPSAAIKAIQLLSDRVDGKGGVICIDTRGNTGYHFNTPFMARAVANQDGIIHIGISREE